MSNGLTGNEIIEIVCPGGNLGDDSGTFFEQDLVGVFLENAPSTTYLTRVSNGVNFSCEINTDGVLPVTLPITNVEYESCKERLIEGCGLLVRNIPTLSEWGLIAMAGLLGIVAFMVIRSKRKTA